MATEEYAARMASRPNSSYATKAHGNNSQTNVESPLRHTSFPTNLMSKQDSGSQSVPELSHSADASEDERGVIHVNAPDRKYNKVTGEGVSTPIVDLGPKGGNTDYEGGYIDEQGYGVPILASDEIRPGSEWQKPAVSPLPEERRASIHDVASRFGSRPGSATGSRPTSRPGSIHGHYNMLSRYTSHEEHDIHTPLDDVEEYEPLFEEDEKTEKKPLTQAERLKHRPDMRRRFPSQDIWEDTPNSLQLQAEVHSPPPTEHGTTDSQASTTFESPAVEAARKGEVSEQEKAKLLPKEARLQKSNFKPHLRDEMHRPGLNKRFPSQDIWEDSPDSARLETTVGGGDFQEDDAGLAAGAVVQTAALSGGISREGATSGASVQPQTSDEAKGIDVGALKERGTATSTTVGVDAKNAAATGAGPTSQAAQQDTTQGTSVSTGSALLQTAKDGISGLFSSLVGSKESQPVREGTVGVSSSVPGSTEGQTAHEGAAGVSSSVSGSIDGQSGPEGTSSMAPKNPAPSGASTIQGQAAQGQIAHEAPASVSPSDAGTVEGQSVHDGIAGVLPSAAATAQGQTAHEGNVGGSASNADPVRGQPGCEGTVGAPLGAAGTVLGKTAREGTTSVSPSATDALQGQSAREGTGAGVSPSTTGSIQGQPAHAGDVGGSASIPGSILRQPVHGETAGGQGTSGGSSSAANVLQGQPTHEGNVGGPATAVNSVRGQPDHEGTSAAGSAQGQSAHDVDVSGSATTAGSTQGRSVHEETTGVPFNTTPSASQGKPARDETASLSLGAAVALQEHAIHKGDVGSSSQQQPIHEETTSVPFVAASATQVQSTSEETLGVPSSAAGASLSTTGVPPSTAGDSPDVAGALQGQSTRERDAGNSTVGSSAMSKSSQDGGPKTTPSTGEDVPSQSTLQTAPASTTHSMDTILVQAKEEAKAADISSLPTSAPIHSDPASQSALQTTSAGDVQAMNAIPVQADKEARAAKTSSISISTPIQITPTSQSASQNTSTGDARSMSAVPGQAKKEARAAETSPLSTSTPSQAIPDSTIANKSVPTDSDSGQTLQGASVAGSAPVQATPGGQSTGPTPSTSSVEHGAQESTSEGSHAMPQIPPRSSKHQDSSNGQATHPPVPARPQKHHHHHHHHATSPHEQSRLSEVYTAPPQPSGGQQHPQDSQNSPLEDPKGSVTEGRKAPVVPHRPKPHVPRTSKVEPSNTEEGAAAAAPRGAFSSPSSASPQETPLGSTSEDIPGNQGNKGVTSTSPFETSRDMATSNAKVADRPATGSPDSATSGAASPSTSSDTKARGAIAIDQGGSAPFRSPSTSATDDAKSESVPAGGHADLASSRGTTDLLTRDAKAGGAVGPDNAASTPSRDSARTDVLSSDNQRSSTSGTEEASGARNATLGLGDQQDKTTGVLATANPSALASQTRDPRSSRTSQTSAGSEASAAKDIASPPLAGKSKPVVSARPGAGSKIAALQAGFMSDLNKRLQVGPQVPQRATRPTEENQDEKAPLADARKGRAKGPTRRKPATSSSPAAGTDAAPSAGAGADKVLAGLSDDELARILNDPKSKLGSRVKGLLSTPAAGTGIAASAGAGSGADKVLASLSDDELARALSDPNSKFGPRIRGLMTTLAVPNPAGVDAGAPASAETKAAASASVVSEADKFFVSLSDEQIVKILNDPKSKLGLRMKGLLSTSAVTNVAGVDAGNSAVPRVASVDAGTSAVTHVAGVDAGTSAVATHASAPTTSPESICLWQVPSTGTFDPVHANYLIKHQPTATASLDGTTEDALPAPLNVTSEPTPIVDSAKESILPTSDSNVASALPSEESKGTIMEGGDI